MLGLKEPRRLAVFGAMATFFRNACDENKRVFKRERFTRMAALSYSQAVYRTEYNFIPARCI
jgi:hypothetical protein